MYIPSVTDSHPICIFKNVRGSRSAGIGEFVEKRSDLSLWEFRTESDFGSGLPVSTQMLHWVIRCESLSTPKVLADPSKGCGDNAPNRHLRTSEARTAIRPADKRSSRFFIPHVACCPAIPLTFLPLHPRLGKDVLLRNVWNPVLACHECVGGAIQGRVKPEVRRWGGLPSGYRGVEISFRLEDLRYVNNKCIKQKGFFRKAVCRFANIAV